MPTAREMMTSEVRFAKAEWSLEELMGFLTEHAISGAPVLDGEKTVGVVSTTDLVRNRLPTRFTLPESSEMLSQAAAAGVAADELSGLRFEQDSGLTVRDIMTPLVYDVSVDTTAREIADVMVRGRIHRVVVTHRGKPVGIVSALDVLRHFQEQRP